MTGSLLALLERVSRLIEWLLTAWQQERSKRDAQQLANDVLGDDVDAFDERLRDRLAERARR